jgi:amino acid adenylation domain-containing protein
MSTSTDLLSILTNLGVSVSLDGEQLVLNAPRNVITDELREELHAQKTELIELLKAVQQDERAPVPVADFSSSLLSRAQQRIWFLDQLDSGNAVWNVASVFRIRGRLNRQALEAALVEIVSRHEVLRSSFHAVDGLPRVRFGAPEQRRFSITPVADTAAARSAAVDAAHLPFDLKTGPLFRARLFAVDADEHYLCLAVHHIVCDGWSLGVLAKELGELYESFAEGKQSPLQAPTWRYADYVAWESEQDLQECSSDLGWWKRQLSGWLPVLELPPDRSRSARRNSEGRRTSMLVPRPLADLLSGMARAYGVTQFMLLLAVFKVLLYRYTGIQDVVVGTVSSYRRRSEFAGMIGMFANPVVLRTDLGGNPAFSQLLARVRETVLGAFAHDTVPFDRLVEVLQPDRDLNQSPLFQICFTYQNFPMSMMEWPRLKLSREMIELPGARYDLSVEVWETAAGLSCDFEFRTGLFKDSTIERVQQHYLGLLEEFVADAGAAIATVPLMGQPERQLLTQEWNSTEQIYPRATIDSLFEAQCRQTPYAVAIAAESGTITYRELNVRANVLAHRLQRLGVAAGTPVGVLIERSMESIIAFLAVLKTGGVYLPLDADYPEERLAFFMKDAGAEILVVSSRRSASKDPGLADFQRLDMDEDTDQTDSGISAASGLESPKLAVEPDAPACILYTSGSTGTPKGVEILHRGIVRLLFGRECSGFGDHEGVLHMAPETFDASLLEIWGPLVHGGQCVICSDRHPTIAGLSHLLDTHRVSAAWITASLFNWIIDEAPHILSSLERIYTGGEALSLPHIRRASQLLTHVQLFNGYGPTEGTVFTCLYPIPRELSEGIPSVPIGRAVSNTTVYILDEWLQPVPVGVRGDLYIGGDGLARGYRNRPELTAERFIPNPFALGSRLYRSGDMARYLDDGNIEFLGRLDHQVKVRGHRVELGEIEAALAEHPAVLAAVVTVHKPIDRGDLLVAWFSARQPIHAEDLRTALRKNLPDYLVPNLFVPLATLPLLDSGKVDREVLAAMPLPDARNEDAWDEPVNDAEPLIASAMAAVLGLERVGPNDDFFALGGHSLLAVQLTARIESLLGRSMSPSVLFQASTPAAIATLLATENSDRPHRLVPLQPSGSQLPLFCFHMLNDGNIYYYLSLVRSLDPDLPVYGLCPGPLELGPDGKLPLVELAARHVKEIKTVQPTGPYRFCGYSSGGIVAFEVAQQLMRAGDIVALILLDSFALPVRFKWSAREILNLIFLQLTREGSHKSAAAYVRQRWKNLGRKIERYRNTGRWEPAPIPDDPENQIRAILQESLATYEPVPYPGRAVLFNARDDRRNNSYNIDGLNGWQRLIRGGIDMKRLSGNHSEIMKDPYVGTLASELQQALANFKFR